MRVIEKSPFIDPEGDISLENRVRATLKHGMSWYAEIQAQDYVTGRLDRSLDDDHVLVRNAVLPGVDVTMPLVLIGPHGVQLILATPAKGIYRAKGDTWLSFNQRAQRFQPSKPNLLTRTDVFAQALLTYIQNQGVPLPEIEPILAFSDPRSHVDSVDPSVRIILADGIRHIAASLEKAPAIMDQEDIQGISRLLTDPAENAILPAHETPLPEPEPVPEPAPVSPVPKPPVDEDPFNFELVEARRRPRRTVLGMSIPQLSLLGIMLVVELIIIGVFAYLVLFAAP
jgi:hypothetical protein